MNFDTGTNDIIGRMIAAKEYGYRVSHDVI